jgi:hypothetical protein
MTNPTRLPDAASLEAAALAGLDPASADADLVPALARALPGFRVQHCAHRRRLLAWLGFPDDRGHSVEAEIGQVIAAGLREHRVHPRHDNARVLLRWADEP